MEGSQINNLVDFAWRNVFRKDFSSPGFVVFDFGISINSQRLRNLMIELKNGLNNLLISQTGKKLNYQWIGRFDQQETTKFHRDNAPEQSFLMLGYEPTKVKSKLFLADFMLFAKSKGISPDEYFDNYNPMFTDGEKQLEPYITEIENFKESSYKIVLINNSCLTESPGVLHKAMIVTKDLKQERIINSIMLYSADINTADTYSTEQENDFITTTLISRK